MLLLPIVLLSAFFWAPVGIITIFKIQSFALLGPYWIILLGLSGASLFAKKDFYWMIYAVLAILTVLNTAGGLKFFGSMKGWH